MKKSKVLYVDLDDTLANFYKASRNLGSDEVDEHMMWDPNFFLNLEPVPGAKGAVFDLMKHGFDVRVLSQPLAECPESYLHKAQWVQLHFPQLYKKIVLTQDKGLCLGHYLIDDNAAKWKEPFESNGGKFIHYPYDRTHRTTVTEEDLYTFWRMIVKTLQLENPYLEK